MTEDIKWDGIDIQIATDGDAETVTNGPLLEQSIGIHVAAELRGNIGDVMSDQSITAITKSINRAVDEDPDIESVEHVEIDEINRQTNTVTVTANMHQDDDSTIVVNV